ncbi:MAG: glucokinase [Candidatus Woesearchaeota archaeon]
MFLKKEKNILVADVGGTKTTFAIINQNKEIIIKRTYPSFEIKNFTDTILQFINLDECKKYKLLDANFAVAGIINKEKNYARMTNLDWTIDVNSILVRTPLRNVILLNDFEAIGLCFDTLKENQYSELTNHGRNPKGTIAIIGAGTGLGMSILAYHNNKHYPLLSEGGHMDFPIIITDKIDMKFQSFMIQKKIYFDSEDIVSGRGIINIYNFLITQKIKHNNNIIKEIKNVSDREKPAIIMKYALEDKDLVCIHTLELFIKYYSRIAKNIALITSCSELLIAGGIAPKIISAMQDSFIEEFVLHNREEFRKSLELIPIFVLTDPDVGLYGASYAKNA